VAGDFGWKSTDAEIHLVGGLGSDEQMFGGK
jgi:hypothetical protein